MTGIRVRGEDGWLQGDGTQTHMVVTQKPVRREEGTRPGWSAAKPLCTCDCGETNRNKCRYARPHTHLRKVYPSEQQPTKISDKGRRQEYAQSKVGRAYGPEDEGGHMI